MKDSIWIFRWRSRLVGLGRTTGNRVGGKTPRGFESLLLRQQTFYQKISRSLFYKATTDFFFSFSLSTFAHFSHIFAFFSVSNRVQNPLSGVILVSIFLLLHGKKNGADAAKLRLSRPVLFFLRAPRAGLERNAPCKIPAKAFSPRIFPLLPITV